MHDDSDPAAPANGNTIATVHNIQTDVDVITHTVFNRVWEQREKDARYYDNPVGLYGGYLYLYADKQSGDDSRAEVRTYFATGKKQVTADMNLSSGSSSGNKGQMMGVLESVPLSGSLQSESGLSVADIVPVITLEYNKIKMDLLIKTTDTSDTYWELSEKRPSYNRVIYTTGGTLIDQGVHLVISTTLDGDLLFAAFDQNENILGNPIVFDTAEMDISNGFAQQWLRSRVDDSDPTVTTDPQTYVYIGWAEGVDEIAHTISLYSGWNMVSFPIYDDGNSTDIQETFGGENYQALYKYNSLASTWTCWNNDYYPSACDTLPRFSDVNPMEAWWIKTSVDKTLVFMFGQDELSANSAYENAVPTLYGNWTLAGFNRDITPATAVSLIDSKQTSAGTNKKVRMLWRYNNKAKTWSVYVPDSTYNSKINSSVPRISTIDRTEGLWIKAE